MRASTPPHHRRPTMARVDDDVVYATTRRPSVPSSPNATAAMTPPSSSTARGAKSRTRVRSHDEGGMMTPHRSRGIGHTEAIVPQTPKTASPVRRTAAVHVHPVCAAVRCATHNHAVLLRDVATPVARRVTTTTRTATKRSGPHTRTRTIAQTTTCDDDPRRRNESSVGKGGKRRRDSPSEASHIVFFFFSSSFRPLLRGATVSGAAKIEGVAAAGGPVFVVSSRDPARNGGGDGDYDRLLRDEGAPPRCLTSTPAHGLRRRSQARTAGAS